MQCTGFINACRLIDRVQIEVSTNRWRLRWTLHCVWPLHRAFRSINQLVRTLHWIRALHRVGSVHRIRPLHSDLTAQCRLHPRQLWADAVAQIFRRILKRSDNVFLLSWRCSIKGLTESLNAEQVNQQAASTRKQGAVQHAFCLTSNARIKRALQQRFINRDADTVSKVKERFIQIILTFTKGVERRKQIPRDRFRQIPWRDLGANQ